MHYKLVLNAGSMGCKIALVFSALEGSVSHMIVDRQMTDRAEHQCFLPQSENQSMFSFLCPLVREE